ncbi:oligosaccharide flippase family protein [Fastidiosibacter lacustris]|uniref:oligosaccharide flippase family protein n=1 Tax=Fastidiosibacter lacustris TaxID=2056695 RepID=UPI000E34DF41|nr:oligosaccharide flippase family protein [Fastidiosibacter lacustris]
MFKKISIVFFGYALAQGILFASSPLLSRLYDQSAFGLLGFVMAFAGVMLPILSLRYEYAMPLVKTAHSKLSLLKICQKLVAVISVVAIFGYLLLNLLFNFHEMSVIQLLIMGVILFTQGNVQASNLYLISYGLTTKMTVGKIYQNIVLVVAQFLLALLIMGIGTGLILALLIGQLVNLVYLRYVSKVLTTSCHVPKKSHALLLLSKFKRLPLLMSWGDLLNSLTSNLPVFFFTSYFGAKTVGLYFFAYSVFSAPLSLLGLAISQVMLKDFADRVIYKKKILKRFLMTSFLLVLCALLYYLVAIILAQYALLIFGAHWQGLKEVIELISLPIACMLVASPLSTLLNTLNKNRYLTMWQSLFFIGTLLALYLCKHFDFFELLGSVTYLWTFMYILYWVVIFIFVVLYEKRLSGRVSV